MPVFQRGGAHRRAAADLLDDDRDPDAAPTGRVQGVLDGDVVVRHDRLDLDAVAPCQVGRHVEVHHVAGVVLDDVQDAGTAVDGLGRRLHLVGGRRGEDLARACCIQHARADESTVHRLVARAAARDEAHLALDGGVGTNDEHRVVVDPDAVAVRCLDALQRLPNDVVRCIDQLLHAAPIEPEGDWTRWDAAGYKTKANVPRWAIPRVSGLR
jgi:hypothetical protein